MQQFGPIDHFVGHSLGGLTISLIAETIEAPVSHKFVLIAPATKTTSTFEGFFSLMRFSPDLKKAFYELVQNPYLESILATLKPIERLKISKAKCYGFMSQDDPVCSYKDLENFKDK
jgi:predicted alpha/beta hydrolase family esterase